MEGMFGGGVGFGLLVVVSDLFAMDSRLLSTEDNFSSFIGFDCGGVAG